MDFSKHKNSNIYIIESYDKRGNSIIKVGYSDVIESRLQNYYHHNPYFSVIETCFISDGLLWERKFHKNNPSIILNEWYQKDMLEEILLTLKNDGADFTKFSKEEDTFNKDLFIEINPNYPDWILKNIDKAEYTYKELEEIFKDEVYKIGYTFCGQYIKDNFPPFDKVRKIKNKIRDTYYKFKL